MDIIKILSDILYTKGLNYLVFVCSISISMLIFYAMYIGMPIIFSLKKYPDYCVGRVICTKILVYITYILCYIYGAYIVWWILGLFGAFALLLLLFKRLWIIPIVVSLTTLFWYHRWEESVLTILMILPFYYLKQIQLYTDINQKLYKNAMTKMMDKFRSKEC